MAKAFSIKGPEQVVKVEVWGRVGGGESVRLEGLPMSRGTCLKRPSAWGHQSKSIGGTKQIYAWSDGDPRQRGDVCTRRNGKKGKRKGKGGDPLT